MKEKNPSTETKEKFTARLEVSNVPIATIKKLNEVARKKGITTAAYMKGIIHDALKEVK